MYCIYKLQSSITNTQVFADIIGLLTGSITDLSEMSASCDVGASSLTRTTLPEWEMHDNAAGAALNGITPTVLKSQWTDSATNFKYLTVQSSNATTLAFVGHESWDAIAHTGTNTLRLDQGTGTVTATLAGAIPLVAGGYLIISAAKSHLFICSFNNSLAASTGVSHSWFMLSEYTRDDPWNTVANGYPSWLTMGQNGSATLSSSNHHTIRNIGLPRVFNNATGVDNTVLYSQNSGTSSVYSTCWATCVKPAGVHSAIPTWQQLTLGQGTLLTKIAADANKLPATMFHPIILTQGTGGNNSTNNNFNGLFLGGDLSSKSSIFMVRNGRGVTFDEIEMNSSLYSIVNIYAGTSSVTLAIKKA